MPAKNQLYKKVLDTAPFGTVFFAYGVCIDANAQALSILKCDRAQIIGAAIKGSRRHRQSPKGRRETQTRHPTRP